MTENLMAGADTYTTLAAVSDTHTTGSPEATPTLPTTVVPASIGSAVFSFNTAWHVC
jgi:hypothetical protein